MTDTAEAKASRPGRWREVLSALASAALLVAAITVTWNTLAKPKPPARVEPKVPSSVQSLQGIPLKGSLSATVALIEYSDFQCPFCRTFATEILPKLEEKYISSGRVLLAFRHYPLEQIHPLARGAAEAAACAFRQNRFWEMHDQFFKKDASIDAVGLFSAASQSRVDPDEWQKCVMSRPVKEVADDVAAAKGLEVRSTPFFLLGIMTPQGVKVTKVWSGARPVDLVSQAIDETLLLASK